MSYKYYITYPSAVIIKAQVICQNDFPDLVTYNKCINYQMGLAQFVMCAQLCLADPKFIISFVQNADYAAVIWIHRT